MTTLLIIGMFAYIGGAVFGTRVETVIRLRVVDSTTINARLRLVIAVACIVLTMMTIMSFWAGVYVTIRHSSWLLMVVTASIGTVELGIVPLQRNFTTLSNRIYYGLIVIVYICLIGVAHGTI